MNLKLLSWNVRGANDINKRRIIKSVVRKQKVDLLCIQETKIQLMTEGVVKNLGVGRFLDWRALEAVGAAGGVLICWDKRSLEILEWEEGQFSISCKFRNVENGVVWCLRVFMALSPKRIGSVFGTNLGQSEEFGENPGV
ncbi:hypothetical protein AAG906_033361 [Vitis piasezkii]